jgi:enoyl-CoA hydratase/carnithine racemase
MTQRGLTQAEERIADRPTGEAAGSIDVDVAEQIATVWLSNPAALNAFTPNMVEDYLAVLDRIDADDEIRVAVVTGRGRGFCAGADLSLGGDTFVREVPSGEGPPPDRAGVIALRMLQCRKPLIAAINGAAVGFGASLVLPMDIRIASKRARVGFSFVRRGIVPDGASSWFLPRIVGISRAAEWMYTGRLYAAAEVLDGGLVRSVHDEDDLLPAAYEIAREFITESAPVSIAMTRQLLWRMAGATDPRDAHEIESRALAERGSSDDAREGVTAFLEKRPANFTMSVTRDYRHDF